MEKATSLLNKLKQFSVIIKESKNKSYLLTTRNKKLTELTEIYTQLNSITTYLKYSEEFLPLLEEFLKILANIMLESWQNLV